MLAEERLDFVAHSSRLVLLADECFMLFQALEGPYFANVGTCIAKGTRL